MSKPPKLKISIVYDDSLDGSEGVAQYVKTLGSWLTSRGHSVTYLVGQTKAKEYHEGRIYSLARNKKVSFNGNKLSIPLFSSGKHIKKTLKEIEPDILHIQMPYSPLMAGKVINLKPNTCIAVGTFHVFPVSKLVIFGSRILKLAYFRSLGSIKKIYSVSPPAQDFAKTAFGISSEISPNMVDISRFRVTAKPTKNIVFLGRLVERKGCAYLIRAFSEIYRDFPDTNLIIAGNGQEKESLKKLATGLGIENRVNFLGFVSEEEKAQLFASAKIACFPSLGGESFGIVLIEAMASGAGVVVGGDNPGYRSVLNDNNVLFDPKNTAELSNLLKSYLADGKTFDTTHKAQQKLISQFDVNNVAQAIEDDYYRLIAKYKRNVHNKNQ